MVTSGECFRHNSSNKFNYTKLGTGTQTLSGTNTYTSTMNVNEGVLLATKAAALPGYNAAGKLAVASGATLAVRAGGTGEWTSAEIDSVLGATTAAFASGSKLGIDVTTGNSFSYANDIGATQAAKGLTKSGDGNVTLSGTNTYSGATTISAGTLTIDTTGVIGGGASGTAITVNGGTLTDNSTVATTGGITGTSSLTITSGTANLNTANNYSGATSVTGTLSLADANAVQNSAVTLKNGATLQLRNNSAHSFNSSGAVVLNSVSAQTVTIDVGNNGSGTDNALTLANGISYAGPASGILAGTYTTQINVTGANGYALSLPSVTFGNGGSYGSGRNRNFVLSLNPTSANVSIGTATLTGAGSRVTVALTLDGTSVGNEITGAISMPAGRPLTKSGTGTWTLSGANSYNGATAITRGKLSIGSAGTINNTSGVVIGTASTAATSEFNYNSSTALTQAVTFATGSTGGTLSGSGTINQPSTSRRETPWQSATVPAR